MKPRELCKAISKIAWGYILLHLDFNLNTLDILPNWAGYLLFISALSAIGEEEESAKLLKPLGTILTAIEMVSWMNKGFLNSYFNLGAVSIIASAISLYFHFQLLTNLAGIAHKYECPQEKMLLNLRTVKTILTTFFAIITSLEIENFVIYALLIIFFVVTIWICKVLFSFKNELQTKLEHIEAETQDEVVV
ncbi:MAG: hypothetical protein IJZ53_02280 [Tyzzerella sp.]|nr:hypothetical protein [Tyzzerella sp.]